MDGLLLAEDITNRLVQHGGASLIVDYGEEIIDKFTLRVRDGTHTLAIVH